MYKKCRFSFASIANEERWKGCKMKKTNDQASYYFHQGTNFMAYKYMGCTLDASSDGFNYVFRVWAPNALSVGLVSDFTGWDEPYQMECITDGGIYECSYHSLVSLERSAYKFRIKTKMISRKKQPRKNAVIPIIDNSDNRSLFLFIFLIFSLP